ncbi:hypothetical protein [Buchnera aphidicola]|uniref:Uncharacterized protein n=1 Tax=Buchnera aphidicola (Aphis gossypii) TaxID=98785 RepID=A0A5J6ZF45_9GAMM|nr:hypothetical protein [Buchnera aphidicola]QFQ32336.1 hypothetical protein FQV32_02900 [Buchnera aphidicola (Aphis gossypii)]UPT14859.1 hypothetical protein HWH54_02900 [Buchnera aphidicola (Aphis gossypii)]
MKIKKFKNIQNKNKKIYNQEIYYNELKNNIFLHKKEIKNIQDNIKNLSKKINYLESCMNRILDIQKPPHY